MFSHVWGSDEVHEGGSGGAIGAVVRQSLLKQTHRLIEPGSLCHPGCSYSSPSQEFAL